MLSVVWILLFVRIIIALIHGNENIPSHVHFQSILSSLAFVALNIYLIL